MGAAAGGWRSSALVACLALGLQAPACASDIQRVEGRYVQREIPASIEVPVDPQGTWQRSQVDGATLVLEGPEGARLSWIHHCGGRQPEPRLASRTLLLGVDLLGSPEQGPVRVDGASGWRVRGRVRDGERSAWLEAVTRVQGSCSDDFLLVTPQRSARASALFDRWWRSFRTTVPAAGASG